MATPNEPPTAFDAAMADLDKASALVRRARSALVRAESAARDAVAEALRVGLAHNTPAFRSEVQRRSPFSPPVVRAIGDDAGIPPDVRYVRTSKPADES